MVGLAGMAIAAFFLTTYTIHRFPVPLGWDTAGYAWRTNIARASGIASLPARVPPPGPVNPGRPGFAVVASILTTVWGGSPLRVAEVMPGVMAAATGLAAGAFVSLILRRSVWVLAAVAIAIGTSVSVVHVINLEGYQDQAIATAVFMAAAVGIAICAWDGRGMWAGLVLMGALGAIHWSFFEMAAMVVALTAFVFVPASYRRWRDGSMRWWETPSATMLGAFIGGAIIAMVWIRVLLSATLPQATLVVAQLQAKLSRDLPAYHWPVLLGAAAAGALVLGWRAEQDGESAARSRVVLGFTLAWCEITLAAFVAQRIPDWAIPTHRILAFAIGIPMLGVIALVALGAFLSQRWRPAGVVVVVVLLGVVGWEVHDQWFAFHPVVSSVQIRQSAGAEDYLERAGVSEDRPVVFIVDDHSPNAASVIWLTGHVIRSQLAPARIPHVLFYLGSPQAYLARKPSALGPGSDQILSANYARLSSFYFHSVDSTYGLHPIALLLSGANPAYSSWVRDQGGKVVAPGVALVDGPQATNLPTGKPNEAESEALAAIGPSSAAWVLGTIVALVVISLVGVGWSSFFFGRWARSWEVLSLAPAVGAGLLVLGGILLNRIGIPLHGAGAIAIAVGVGATGMAIAKFQWSRRADPRPVL